MKKILLFVGLFTSSLAGFGQMMKITSLGGSVDISGTTYTATTSGTSQIAIDFDVYNESPTGDNFIITRVIMAQPNGWGNEVCWGLAGAGQCFPDNPATIWVTPASVHLMEGDFGSLTVHIDPFTNPNQYARYRYYCGTAASPKMDSIDVVVNQSLDVKEVKKEVSLTVSPNPASENVLVKVSNFEKGNIKIVDVLGNVVLSEGFSGSKNVNVSDFKNGVYFILISGDGNSFNRKLVVRH